MAAAETLDLRYADDKTDIIRCYPLMRQLRPHLATEQEFVDRWQRQREAGYRLIALWQDQTPVALAGFRLQENLVHGVHLYVDDLVTDEAARSGGLGHLLMDRLKEEGRSLGVDKLILDTPLTNVLGHRFYYREGLLARALRFYVSLTNSEAGTAG